MAGPKRNYIQKSTGEKVCGTTTALNAVLAKPALTYWGYTQGMWNYKELSKAVARALRKFDQESPIVQRLQEVITGFETLGLYDKRDEAADAGSLGHAFVETYLKKQPEPDLRGLPKEVVSKAEGCFLTYLDWEKGRELVVVDSEVPVVSDRKPVGGTIDHLIQTSYTRGSPNLEILDLKTGKDIYFDAKIQVANYGDIWNEHHPDKKIRGYHILRLGPNGEFTHKFFPELNDYVPIFDLVLDIYLRMKKLGEKL